MRHFLLLLFAMVSTLCQGQTRLEQTLASWKFSRDSVHWKPVSVPHDWAISGPFDKKWDLQKVAIEQNGETEATEKSGRSGSLPWIGRGYYTTEINLKQVPKQAMLVFDGAMAEPMVYVNGHLAGYWKYGYNAFRVDAGKWLRKGKNRVTVSLNNQEESSRWYPGAGLYRPVTLVITQKEYIDDWKTFVQTKSISADKATLHVAFAVVGAAKGQQIQGIIMDQQGKKVANFTVPATQTSTEVVVNHPQLWSPESPQLYQLALSLTALDKGNKQQMVDKTLTMFGIRTIHVSREGGFQLNGVTRKIQGVCLHHDLGPLGAAVNKAALIRQIRILKDMGCDAIRTSHNMPSALQMEICDSMGMMVMAESFDMWIYPKCKNGYAKYFKEWADRDITNLIMHHRNHPSIIMWSIGNEIPEQWSKEGRDISAHLQQLCHQLDPTRPVTQGMDRAEEALKSGFAQVMDVPGFNYRVQKYDTNITQLPKGFLLGSETASTVSSRGIYKFPVKITDQGVYEDGQCSSYDTEFCSWSNLPDADFLMQEDRPYTIGQFVWTGFDYLGEPTPYDTYWPSRSSYFGICDLAGLPKDRYYLYRSQWQKHDHTLHMLPHWNWKGREGQITPIFVYTDFPSAELFVNGKSMGRKTKQAYTVPVGSAAEEKPLVESKELLQRYRLMWDSVRYEPGEVEVVAYDKGGNVAMRQTMRTAEAPASIVLKADKMVLNADKDDLCFIEVSLVDNRGTFVPTANDEVLVNVKGAAHFKAICNGDATSLESFAQPQMKLFNGKLVFVVQNNGKCGNIAVDVTVPKLGLTQTLLLKAQ